VDPRTFNVTLAALESRMSPRVKAVMAVHVLGNSICMADLHQFIRKHKLILIEDTCESLGTMCTLDGDDQPRMLGTVGDFGTFSFYFSHHITSGEGGMVVCKTIEDYNLVRCLRAHGWTRHLTDRAEVEARYPDIDSRFLFVNVGYNLRPLEVQGAMLRVQIQKLDAFNACRRDNMARIARALSKDPRFGRVMAVMEASEGADPAWFGIGAMLNERFAHLRKEYLAYLDANGVENRPVISGNFTRQPCIVEYCEGERPQNYPGAEAVHSRGFFVGVHQLPIPDAVIDQLVHIMLAYPPFLHIE
jgi:CDP-4-dehydro-6-deoxyglucose reductase, E1